MSSHRRRTTEEKRERLVYQIENVVHGLAMAPVRWRDGVYHEVPVEEARRVQCACGVHYKPNQGTHIRRHFENKHGYSWKAAWDGYSGGEWRKQADADFRAKLEADIAAIDETLANYQTADTANVRGQS